LQRGKQKCSKRSTLPRQKLRIRERNQRKGKGETERKTHTQKKCGLFCGLREGDVPGGLVGEGLTAELI